MWKSTLISTLRHASTDYNLQKRYAGTLDVPLNRRGIAEAQLAAAKLRNPPFDVAVASPLKRALETVRILTDKRIPIVVSELCRERNFGVLEGLTWEQVPAVRPPILIIQVGGDQHTVNPAGGEALEQVWQRALKFRRFLLKNHSGTSVLVVSHGVFLQLFHGLLLGLNCIESLARYPANLELWRFRLEGEQVVDHSVCRLGEDGADHW